MTSDAAGLPARGGAERIRTADVAARVDPADAGSVRRALDELDAAALRRLGREARQLLDDDGVTYRPVGRHGEERWRLDPVPLVLDAEEWRGVDAGVTQRAELLDLVLTDLYGPRDLLRTGQLPPEVVYAHPGFLRPLDRVRLPGPHQLTICATDLMRDATGAWRPVSDRTQVPSGAAYALANRSALGRLLPALHRASKVERLAPYLRSLRTALQAAAPPRPDEPRIAVLTGGTGAETAFEHGHLAGLLGYPLVEGPDLAVRDGRLWLRSLGGTPAAIDVLLRRVDAWWCDPLELRPDSALGAPGLVEATRRGGLSVVNGLGAGVLENAGLWAFLPALSRAVLGQDLRLEQARTLWFGDPEHRAEAEARFDELVVKPIARTPRGEDLHDVPRLSAAQRDELRARIDAHPHRWVAQERIEGPATRSLAPDGRVVRARTVLRTFAVAAGSSYHTMHGGLARVSDADRLAIANSLGAWSKDTWVLGGDHEASEGFWLRPGPAVAADAPETVVSARTVENLLWFGRYAERAEAVVRLLRAVDDRRSEAFGGTPAITEVIDRLLVALTRVTLTAPGFEQPARRGAPDTELTSLVLDVDRPGTIAFSVARLLHAARAVREQLSTDTWPVLTTLERLVLGDDDEAATLATDARGPAHGRGALGPVLTALLALQGLGSESLVRDPSWRFLDAGRRLERAQQLVRLLRTTVVAIGDADQAAAATADDTADAPGPTVDLATTSLLLESVLMVCESVMTYRRRYRSRAQLATVLELLLLDEDNPRSLQWQVDRLVTTLPRLPDHPGEGQRSPAEEAVRTAATALRTADVTQLHGEALLRLLDRLDVTLQRAGNELANTVFVGGPALRPLVEERTGTAGDVLLA